MEIAIYLLKFYQWNAFLFSLFKSSPERRHPRDSNQRRKKKENRGKAVPKDSEEKDKEQAREEKPIHRCPHWHGSGAVCDRHRSQVQALHSPNSQNGQVFAKSMIWQSPCILHTVSTRSSIHLVQRADCHFPLETHTLH